jgi:hypothetical protein
MDNQLSDKLAIRLEQAFRSAGVDTSTMQDSNPYDPRFDNPGGQQKRMLLEAVDPSLAQELKAEIPGLVKQSLGMRAAIARGESPDGFTGALKAEYSAANPISPEQAAEEESNILAKLEAQTEQLQRKREGDAGYEQRLAREEAKAKAAAERLAEGQRLDQRIREKQQQTLTQARIAAGNVILPSN